jgi:hypothetical protein
VNDAESFVKHLLSIGVPPEQIAFLKNEQVTTAEMGKYVSTLLNAKGKAYLFYSGHGLYFPKLGFSFTCYDTKKQDLTNTAYQMSRLKTEMEKMQSERLVILLDACHSGGAKAPNLEEDDEESSKDAVTLGKVTEEGQKKLNETTEQSEKPVAIITACQQNEVSREGQKGHGIFTQVLLEGLSGKADRDKNGRVDMDELSVYLNSEVFAQTKRGQRPECKFSRAWATDQGLPVAVVPADDAEAKRQQEEAARQADIKRQQEEAARQADIKRQQEEAARQADIKRQQDEAAQQAEIKRQQDEAARIAREKEAARLADETKRRREEAARIARERESARYKKSNAGVILDNQTNLEWFVGPDSNTTWDGAKSWTDRLTVDGGGWRMPTIEELRRLYQKGKGARNMDPLFVTSGWVIWSCDEVTNSSARNFNFNSGNSYSGTRNGSFTARGFAVRTKRNAYEY